MEPAALEIYYLSSKYFLLFPGGVGTNGAFVSGRADEEGRNRAERAKG